MKKLIPILIFLIPSVANAQSIRKAYSGGTSAPGDATYTTSQVYEMLADAQPGETLYLENGFQFNAPGSSFVLGEKNCPAQNDTCYITFRSGVDSSGTITGTFPDVDIRFTPGLYTSLAKIKSTVNNQPGLRTVWPSETGTGICVSIPCVANYWKIENIEFINNPTWNARTLIQIGTNNAADPLDITAGDTQDKTNEIPHHIILDRIYMHGDPIHGQHVGLMNAGRDTVMKNSYCGDIFTPLADTQCVSILNTTGPQSYINNYMAASGENLMTGGDDPKGQFNATVLASPAPTVNSARISACGDMGQSANHRYFSIEVGGAEYQRMIDTINTTTCDITWLDALPGVPDQPGDADNVHWTWSLGGLIIEKNEFTKPLTWQSAQVATPSAPTATPSATGGSCATGTYSYRILAFIYATNGHDNDYYSVPGPATSSSVTGPNGRTALSWPAVTNASSYRVYRDSTYYDVGTNSYNDTCAAPTGSQNPASITVGNKPVVKNLVELKSCDGLSEAGNCYIRYNYIHTTWKDGQNMAVNLKSWNQYGTDDSGVIRFVYLDYNVIASAPRGLVICGMDCDGHGSGIASDIFVRNNLFYDISSSWGEDLSAIFTATGGFAGAPPQIQPIRLTIDHNTILFPSTNMGPIQFDTTTGNKLLDLVLTNNLTRRGSGTFGAGLRTLVNGSYTAEGTTSWNNASTGAGRLAANNTWSGATCTNYPETTHWCDNEATFTAAFVNYSSCIAGTIANCALSGVSTYDNAGTDGKDLGADIATLVTVMDPAFTGNSQSGGVTGSKNKTKLLLGVGAPNN